MQYRIAYRLDADDCSDWVKYSKITAIRKVDEGQQMEATIVNAISTNTMVYSITRWQSDAGRVALHLIGVRVQN